MKIQITVRIILEHEVDKKSEVIEQFKTDCYSLHQKREKVRVKSNRLQKEARETELDLNKIQSKYVKLAIESEYIKN